VEISMMNSLVGLRVCFAGSADFGLPSLQALIAHGCTIVRVYSQPDKPAGRGSKLTPTPIAQFALDQQLDLVRTDDINALALPQCDVLVVIAFGQKLSPAIVDAARLGAINLHASRLPKYRGAAPIHWAVINGDPFTGNSVIRLAQKMDAGSVLGMSKLPIDELATTGEIYERLSADGAVLLPKVVEQLVQGTATAIEQDHTQFTKAPKLSRDMSTLDFSKPATVLANQIRGMHPWPGCQVVLMDGEAEVSRMTLVRAQAVAGVHEQGVINAAGLVGTGDGLLQIIELQPQGKKAMPLASFTNGKPWNRGMRLSSQR
jgi:methionyl-tRNA formyltransferase